jgi:hypothetical protein
MTVIPGSKEVEIKRIMVCDQSRQKVSETPSQLIAQVYWCMPVIPAMWEA